MWMEYAKQIIDVLGTEALGYYANQVASRKTCGAVEQLLAYLVDFEVNEELQLTFVREVNSRWPDLKIQTSDVASLCRGISLLPKED